MIDKIDPNKEAEKIGIALPVPWNKGLEIISDADNIAFLESVKTAEIKVFFKDYVFLKMM